MTISKERIRIERAARVIYGVLESNVIKDYDKAAEAALQADDSLAWQLADELAGVLTDIKEILEPDLEEPHRTAFWKAVDALQNYNKQKGE